MRPGYESCTGCHVCALPCPVFRQSRDLTLTLHGRARALLAGATPSDVAPSTLACVLCGACEPVCPEEIDTVGLTLDVRRVLTSQGENPLATALQERFPSWIEAPPLPSAAQDSGRKTALLASSRFESAPEAMSQILQALGDDSEVVLAVDSGDDLVVRREAGLEIPETRRQQFLAGLPSGGAVVVVDGLLLRLLREWRPDLRAMSLGEALLRRPAIMKALQPRDLLVVDSRAFHTDHARLVRFYDQVRTRSGCDTNLDLQRVAIPTGAVSLQARLEIGDHDVASQVQWILEGRTAERVVVEAIEDLTVFRRHGGLPVCHLADVTGGVES